ncbi:4Fe-4S binding protein [Bacteroidota bacterium]
MIRFLRNNSLPVYAFFFTCLILGMVQWKIERPMLMAERFLQGTGWIEILLLGVYAGWITGKMLDPAASARWRRITWTIFTIVFFGQLGMGLAGFETFLMTGKLHLPIPLMILGGPVFRGQISFMPILFLSTIVISGPAWCSQLCYFGALDNLAAKGKTDLSPIQNKFRIKHILLIAIILITIMLRVLGLDTRLTTAIAIVFGVVGIGIIILVSRRKGKMVHCILWCPIGTLVNYMKLASPLRMYIDDSCTNCMACTLYCNYDALGKADILKRKPGLTCTYCGDCLSSCKTESIRYRFFSLQSQQARNTWIVLTISLHAIFLGLARM